MISSLNVSLYIDQQPTNDWRHAMVSAHSLLAYTQTKVSFFIATTYELPPEVVASFQALVHYYNCSIAFIHLQQENEIFLFPFIFHAHLVSIIPEGEPLICVRGCVVFSEFDVVKLITQLDYHYPFYVLNRSNEDAAAPFYSHFFVWFPHTTSIKWLNALFGYYQEHRRTWIPFMIETFQSMGGASLDSVFFKVLSVKNYNFLDRFALCIKRILIFNDALPLSGHFSPAHLHFWRYTLHIQSLFEDLQDVRFSYLILDTAKQVYRQITTPLLPSKRFEKAPSQPFNIPDVDYVCVVYCIHDSSGSYWHWLLTAMTSVLLHSSMPVKVYVFHDHTLSEVAKTTLTQMVAFYAQHQPHQLLWQAVACDTESGIDYQQFSPAAAYRLMIPKLLAHEPHAIYLDCDTLCNDFDITQCLTVLDDQHALFGVVCGSLPQLDDMKEELELVGLNPEQYINSGVLIMRPAQLPSDWYERFLSFMKQHPKVHHIDQTFINFDLQNNIQLISRCFNLEIDVLDGMFNTFSDYKNKLLHFVSKYKPFGEIYFPVFIHFWRYTCHVPSIHLNNRHTNLSYGIPFEPHRHYPMRRIAMHV